MAHSMLSTAQGEISAASENWDRSAPVRRETPECRA